MALFVGMVLRFCSFSSPIIQCMCERCFGANPKMCNHFKFSLRPNEEQYKVEKATQNIILFTLFWCACYWFILKQCLSWWWRINFLDRLAWKYIVLWDMCKVPFVQSTKIFRFARNWRKRNAELWSQQFSIDLWKTIFLPLSLHSHWLSSSKKISRWFYLLSSYSSAEIGWFCQLLPLLVSKFRSPFVFVALPIL